MRSRRLAPTRVCELRDGEIRDYTLTRRDFGLAEPEPDAQVLAPGATPAENAAILRSVLDPKANDGATLARRELVAVNASAAFYARGEAVSWREGQARAVEVLDSGAALRVLDAFVDFTRHG